MGHINKPHGTKGEVFVWSLTDHPGEVFLPGVILYPAGPDARTPDSDRPPLQILTSRPFRKGMLVGFEGASTRTEAEQLRDTYLLRPTSELLPASAGEFFYHELLDMDVETRDGTSVGTITEVYELRPADLLEVRGAEGTVFVPFTKEIVVEVDREGARLIIDPPEGLLDL